MSRVMQRTWPYGTKRRARVLERSTAKVGGQTVRVMVLEELDRKEAHVLVGNECCDAGANRGDEGTLTFTQGGPTGGYWKFSKTV